MTTIIGFLRFVLGVIISIAMAIVEIIVLPFGDRRGHLFHAVARAWARMVLFTSGVRVTVHGLEKIGYDKHYIFVSNHASMFDIPAILAGIPNQIRIIYKKELEVIPFFGWGLKWGAYIGINRGRGPEARRSLDEAIERIRKGASLLLYAEGTRTLDGRLQPFKRGAFNLAVRTGIPVVPLTVNGSYPILPKHSMAIRPGSINLVLSDPIPVSTEQGKEAEMKLMQQVHSAIAAHYIDQ